MSDNNNYNNFNLEVLTMNEKRLVRMKYDRMFLGVASGVAHYLNMDPVLVRLAFVLLFFLTAGGPVLLAYFILAIVLPEEMSVSAKAHVFDDEEIVIKD